MSIPPFALVTPRLRVTPWTEADHAGLRALAGDPRVMEHVNAGVPWSAADCTAFLERQRRSLRRDGVCLGAVRAPADEGVVGLAGLQAIGATGEFEIGWWLLPRLWGRGLGTELGRACVAHAFAGRGWSRVHAIAAPANLASQRVMAKLGMRFEARATRGALGYDRATEVEVVSYVLDAANLREPAR